MNPTSMHYSIDMKRLERGPTYRYLVKISHVYRLLVENIT